MGFYDACCSVDDCDCHSGGGNHYTTVKKISRSKKQKWITLFGYRYDASLFKRVLIDDYPKIVEEYYSPIKRCGFFNMGKFCSDCGKKLGVYDSYCDDCYVHPNDSDDIITIETIDDDEYGWAPCEITKREYDKAVKTLRRLK